MNLLLALLCAAAGDPPATLQEAEAPGPRDDVFVRVRAGAWTSRAFDFEATRADGFLVSTDGETMGSGALDFGVAFRERFVLFASAEAGLSNDLETRVAGVFAGLRDRNRSSKSPALPHEITAYAGGLWGQLEVRQTGFGDFDDAWGFAAGLEFTWFLHQRWTFSLIGEYRHLKFGYEPDVVSGDDSIGGSGVWGGASIDVRF
jgi:hypothetical protein